jgi:dihydrofolate reductase
LAPAPTDIARPDGDLEWLTSRPKPESFYGMSAFMSSIETKLLGRKTYEMSLRMGAKFNSKNPAIVFSRHAPPENAPSGVEFVNAIGPFVRRLRVQPGKDIWLMGGGFNCITHSELVSPTSTRCDPDPAGILHTSQPGRVHRDAEASA